jgi:tetratricopeptide (TPR) repeat protein
LKKKKATKYERIFSQKKNEFYFKDLDLNKEEKFLLKFIKKIPPAFFEKNIKEWVECFILMEAFTISDYLLSLYEANIIKRNENLEENVMFEYFRIETFFKRKKMKLVILRSDLVLCKFPLLEQEKLSFLYIKAEALKSLNMRSEAIKYFKKIVKSDPFYRLTKKRLEELEAC